jgi:hypothetical protein
MGNKQTAVKWLLENLKESLSIEQATAVINKAKEMERQQIETAFQAGDGDAYNLKETKTWAEQYYNETYE